MWSFGFNDGFDVTYSMRELDGDLKKIEYVDTTYDQRSLGGGRLGNWDVAVR